MNGRFYRWLVHCFYSRFEYNFDKFAMSDIMTEILNGSDGPKGEYFIYTQFESGANGLINMVLSCHVHLIHLGPCFKRLIR